ncbi:hypothetical protein C1645_832384 [Glomus cerebriforme]|uniref:Integrase zinc-binding domain-containing protein n=1 Tax=Glomus cerebriforme TaxID=658196 RepID=A0A397SHI0_9GLOM|nr:hypothetical protein C1645_832384 [Glomus cerebriforme]
MENFAFMSQETFEKVISSYTTTLKNENYHSIYLISRDVYEDISPGYRIENAKNNINRNVHSLPVLVREDMYRVFCLAHLDVSHKKGAGTYNKLRSEWRNINRNLIKYFCERCSICAVRMNRKFGSEVAGKAIIARNFLSRLQLFTEIGPPTILQSMDENLRLKL